MFLLLVATAMVSNFGYWRVSKANWETRQQRDRAMDREKEAVELRNQEAIARADAETKRQQARASLRRSLLHQAEALRQSTDAGWRQPAYDALTQAATLSPGLDLRTEYLRWLDKPELRPVRDLVFPSDVPLSASFRQIANPESRRIQQSRYWLESWAGLLGSESRILVAPTGGWPAEFDAMTGNMPRLLDGVGELTDPLAIRADVRLLAAHRADRKGTEIWDLTTGKRLGELKDELGRSLQPTCIAFSEQEAAALDPTEWD